MDYLNKDQRYIFLTLFVRIIVDLKVLVFIKIYMILMIDN
jgi:hypothetical protein